MTRYPRRTVETETVELLESDLTGADFQEDTLVDLAAGYELFGGQFVSDIGGKGPGVVLTWTKVTDAT